MERFTLKNNLHCDLLCAAIIKRLEYCVHDFNVYLNISRGGIKNAHFLKLLEAEYRWLLTTHRCTSRSVIEQQYNVKFVEIKYTKRDNKVNQ